VRVGLSLKEGSLVCVGMFGLLGAIYAFARLHG
jgi:hypothetical protein